LVRKAEERMRKADADLWRLSSRLLSRQQQETLRSLIDEWIKANPQRELVSFVRFDEFTDLRTQPREAERTKAQGLLRDVVAATTAVESARLLGERALWFAARYPYLIGQQAEKTMFRAAEQPEVQKALEAVDSIQKLTAALTARVETLDRDLDARVETIAAQVRAERTAAIEQAGTRSRRFRRRRWKRWRRGTRGSGRRQSARCLIGWARSARHFWMICRRGTRSCAGWPKRSVRQWLRRRGWPRS
jgi:aminopeptidase N